MRLSRLLLTVVLSSCLAATALAAPASAATVQPPLQSPFPCGQAWSGDAGRSTAHRGVYEIDFNRGPNATSDLGDDVVASAAGRVVTAANQGEANGYGNLVKIDHGGGWFTYYAHLSRIRVTAGTRVQQGQLIGQVGNTSKRGNNITPHLHFEVRGPGSYPSNVARASFDGQRFAYPRQTVTSRNCNDPQRLCGSASRIIDYAYLEGSNGTHYGTVYLAWNSATKQNCVVTVKHRDRGRATKTSAYLQPAGSNRVTDSGSFSSYAGPVSRSAPGCIRWGGSISGVTYDSPKEHC